MLCTQLQHRVCIFNCSPRFTCSDPHQDLYAYILTAAPWPVCVYIQSHPTGWMNVSCPLALQPSTWFRLGNFCVHQLCFRIGFPLFNFKIKLLQLCFCVFRLTATKITRSRNGTGNAFVIFRSCILYYRAHCGLLYCTQVLQYRLYMTTLHFTTLWWWNWCFHSSVSVLTQQSREFRWNETWFYSTEFRIFMMIILLVYLGWEDWSDLLALSIRRPAGSPMKTWVQLHHVSLSVGRFAGTPFRG